jgi:hypothetical protein
MAVKKSPKRKKKRKKSSYSKKCRSNFRKSMPRRKSVVSEDYMFVFLKKPIKRLPFDAKHFFV